MQNGISGLPDNVDLILFDGYCNLCNGAVQFILKRDPKERFRYTSLSSEFAEKLMREYPDLAQVNSIVLYSEEKIHVKSSAVLRIAKRMGGAWPTFSAFLIIPRFLRNPIYDFIARNRYRWFGKKETCMVPEKKVSHLFL